MDQNKSLPFERFEEECKKNLDNAIQEIKDCLDLEFKAERFEDVPDDIFDEFCLSSEDTKLSAKAIKYLHGHNRLQFLGGIYITLKIYEEAKAHGETQKAQLHLFVLGQHWGAYKREQASFSDAFLSIYQRLGSGIGRGDRKGKDTPKHIVELAKKRGEQLHQEKGWGCYQTARYLLYDSELKKDLQKTIKDPQAICKWLKEDIPSSRPRK